MSEKKIPGNMTEMPEMCEACEGLAKLFNVIWKSMKNTSKRIQFSEMKHVSSQRAVFQVSNIKIKLIPNLLQSLDALDALDVILDNTRNRIT